jgi:hypothetical protein
VTTAIADGRPALSYEIRPTAPDDLAFVRDTWRESNHGAQGRRRRLPWAAWKLLYGSVIDDLLSRADVYTIAAYDDTRERPIVGWMAWTPGKVPAVHYVYTRFDDRRHGVAHALLRSPLAQLGGRLVYTYLGARPKGGQRGDEVLAASLGRRGVSTMHVPIRDWLKAVRV